MVITTVSLPPLPLSSVDLIMHFLSAHHHYHFLLPSPVIGTALNISFFWVRYNWSLWISEEALLDQSLFIIYLYPFLEPWFCKRGSVLCETTISFFGCVFLLCFVFKRKRSLALAVQMQFDVGTSQKMPCPTRANHSPCSKPWSCTRVLTLCYLL